MVIAYFFLFLTCCPPRDLYLSEHIRKHIGFLVVKIMRDFGLYFRLFAIKSYVVGICFSKGSRSESYSFCLKFESLNIRFCITDNCIFVFKLKTNICAPNKLNIVGKYSICMRWSQIFLGGAFL